MRDERSLQPGDVPSHAEVVVHVKVDLTGIPSGELTGPLFVDDGVLFTKKGVAAYRRLMRGTDPDGRRSDES